MITRQQYLNKQATHEEYYSQFVTPFIKKIVENHIGLDKIKDSNDHHFNDIPLRLWDNASNWLKYYPTVFNQLKEAGDYATLAGLVCILKQAARELKEENPEKSS